MARFEIEPALVRRLRDLEQTQQPPDVLVGAVGPWYCLDNFIHLAKYPRQFRELVSLWSKWTKTTILYFKVEHGISIIYGDGVKNDIIDVINDMTEYELRNRPNNIKYVEGAHDMQKIFGNRKVVDWSSGEYVVKYSDPVLLDSQADMWAAALVLNYICAEEDEAVVGSKQPDKVIVKGSHWAGDTEKGTTQAQPTPPQLTYCCKTCSSQPTT